MDWSVAVAAVFVWVGMVVAISFVETPLKFRAPGVTPALALVLQIVAVRPVLSRRSDEVLAGADGPRSRAHHGYVALEVVKVIALLTTGILLLA